MARIIILGTRSMNKAVVVVLLVAGAAAVAGSVRLQPDRSAREQDWPFYGGDQGGMKYSPLTDISAGTLARLRVEWEWSPREKALSQFGTRPGNFQATPLMIDNVLYFSTPYNRVVALNADTGAELWAFDPKAMRTASRRTEPASSIAAWRRGATPPTATSCASSSTAATT
jgi:Glucose dehydrogenase